MMKFLQSAVGLLFLAGAAGAQITSIPAATGGGVGGAATSIRSGLLAAIPATCTVADVYWATDASLTGGAWKEYSCTATNTWTQKKVSNVDGTLTFTSSANGDVVGSVTSGVFDTLAGNATFGAAADKDYASAYMRPPTVAFASLPAAATVSGRVFVVTDCATASCTAGGGSTRVWMRSNGSTYDVVSPGGGPAALATQGLGYITMPMDGGDMAGSTNDFFNNNVAAPDYYQFVPQTSITVRRVRIRYQSATASGTAGSAMAFYDSTGAKLSGGDATSRIIDSTTGVVEFAFPSAPTLTAGTVYFFGYATQQALQLIGQYNWPFAYYNETSFPRLFTGANAATGTGTGLTMPATIGTRTASARYPMIAVAMP